MLYEIGLRRRKVHHRIGCRRKTESDFIDKHTDTHSPQPIGLYTLTSLSITIITSCTAPITIIFLHYTSTLTAKDCYIFPYSTLNNFTFEVVVIYCLLRQSGQVHRFLPDPIFWAALSFPHLTLHKPRSEETRYHSPCEMSDLNFEPRDQRLIAS